MPNRKPKWLCFVGNVMHDLLHKHVTLRKDFEEYQLCVDRWPFRQVEVYYRPHPHQPWAEVTFEEFKRKVGFPDDNGE